MTYFTDEHILCQYICFVHMCVMFISCAVFFFFYRITQPRQRLLLSFHQVCKVCLLSSSHGSTGRSRPWWRCCSQFCTIEPVDPFQQPLIAPSFLHCQLLLSLQLPSSCQCSFSNCEYILVSPLTLTSPKELTHFQSISLATSFRLSGCSVRGSIQLLILQFIFSHLHQLD